MKISTKAEFLALARRGKLGNQLRSWDTLAEVAATGYHGYVTVRARALQSPWFITQTEVSDVQFAMQRIEARGGPGPDGFYIQEIPYPGTMRVMNLEAHRTEAGLEITHENYVTTPVRGIRQRGKALKGLGAKLEMESLLSQPSIQMMDEIWEDYPDAIIEATEFVNPLGTLGKRLVIWEVRDY